MDRRARDGGDVFCARMAVMIGRASESRQGGPVEGRSMAAGKNAPRSGGLLFVAGAAGRGNCSPTNKVVIKIRM